MATVSEIKAEAESKMQHSLDALSRELIHLRAGRANSGLVDHIRVEAYGTQMPLNQLATISTPDAATILISPFDKSLAQAVSKAINMSDVRKRFIDLGADPIGSTPDELPAYIRSELAKWGKVIKAAGIKPE